MVANEFELFSRALGMAYATESHCSIIHINEHDIENQMNQVASKDILD